MNTAQRPNIILIVTDDQSINDNMPLTMPQTYSRIFQQGVMFANAFATTPLCCPSRSSILTGKYAHNTGVKSNTDTLRHPTFVVDIHANGYRTGMVGKYLNSWNATPRPEFDYWVSKGNNDYYNPTLNVNGTAITWQGYTTFIYEQYAVDFIQRSLEGGHPFFLYFCPDAPHTPSSPAPDDFTLFDDIPLFRPPSYNEADVSDKPKWIQRLPLLTSGQMQQMDDAHKNRLRTLKSADEAIAGLLDELKRDHIEQNTAIFFLSDHGYFLGEHRIFEEKQYVYESGVRIPFAFLFPPVTLAGNANDKLIGTIDIAPTIYGLAGVKAPHDLDGKSLLSLLLEKDPLWRSEILLENWPLNVVYQAVHTSDFVAVKTVRDSSELYDLRTDPDQLVNIFHDATYASERSTLFPKIDSLATYKGNDTIDATIYDPPNTPYVSMTNYPNPFNGLTTIVVKVTTPQNVELKVFDMLGRMVRRVGSWALAEGTYRITIDMRDLPSGTYLVTADGLSRQVCKIAMIR